MNDEEAIRRTLAQYCQFADDGRVDEWADLYTTDAIVVADGILTDDRTVLEGREVIRDFAHESMSNPDLRAKHLILNSVIELDGDNAVVTSDFLGLIRTRRGPVVTLVGRYVDKMTRDGDRWLFAVHEIVIPPDWKHPEIPQFVQDMVDARSRYDPPSVGGDLTTSRGMC